MAAIRNASDFGAAIRARRVALGYTQTDVAEICNVSVMFVSRLERGKATAELGKALTVANAVGLDIAMSERGSDEA